MDHADDTEVVPPADHADDAEVIPPGGSCGRHGGRPSRAANGEGPPPRGPQCMSAAAVRTTRRSSLPTDHADDTEVVPPALQKGRVRLRADRSA